MNYTEVLRDNSGKISSIALDWANSLLSKVVENPTEFMSKVAFILVLSIFIFLASKISHKISKFVIIIASAILILSFVFSF